jgi:hypothetical protein
MRTTIDGGASANVGANLSLDVGQAAFREQFFTTYHTTVAIAYADSTNGDLKYARLDVDDPAAKWFIGTVDNLSGVTDIDLKLHSGFLSTSSVQAQIAYQDVKRHVIKYAYRNQTWFSEAVASSGGAGGAVQLSFTSADNPSVTYYNSAKRALYSSSRNNSGNWSAPLRLAPSSSLASVSLNDRADQTILSYLNKSKTAVVATDLV